MSFITPQEVADAQMVLKHLEDLRMKMCDIVGKTIKTKAKLEPLYVFEDGTYIWFGIDRGYEDDYDVGSMKPSHYNLVQVGVLSEGEHKLLRRHELYVRREQQVRLWQNQFRDLCSADEWRERWDKHNEYAIKCAKG